MAAILFLSERLKVTHDLCSACIWRFWPKNFRRDDQFVRLGARSHLVFSPKNQFYLLVYLSYIFPPKFY